MVFTFEVNDTNSRPSTSSSSGCIATVNDGLWNTVGEAAAAFHSLPLELVQRLLIFFLLLWFPGDDPWIGVEVAGVLVIAVKGSSMGSSVGFSVGSTSGRFWTSTSSPRECLPLKQGIYGSSPVEGDMMGFRTSRVTCSFEKAEVFVL